jgi:hypothetical protein
MQKQVSTALRRLNYTSGQLLTAESLQTEQDYFRSRQQRHNRWLHGAGVVTGLAVTVDRTGRQVIVQPGYALDCAGNELLVESPCAFELAFEDDLLFLALLYQERLAEPVPAPGGLDEGEQFLYAVIEEYTLAGLYTENPQPHENQRRQVGTACGAPHPLVIAVLERSSHGWQVRQPGAAAGRDG